MVCTDTTRDSLRAPAAVRPLSAAVPALRSFSPAESDAAQRCRFPTDCRGPDFIRDLYPQSSTKGHRT